MFFDVFDDFDVYLCGFDYFSLLLTSVDDVGPTVLVEYILFVQKYTNTGNFHNITVSVILSDIRTKYDHCFLMFFDVF